MTANPPGNTSLGMNCFDCATPFDIRLQLHAPCSLCVVVVVYEQFFATDQRLAIQSCPKLHLIDQGINASIGVTDHQPHLITLCGV